MPVVGFQQIEFGTGGGFSGGGTGEFLRLVSDGFYVRIQAQITQDSTLQWSSGSMQCWKDEGYVASPRSEAFTSMTELWRRLESLYYPAEESLH